MEDFLTRFLTDLIGRIDGPMQFRLYLQPLMAIAFAFRDGRKDARAGRPAYGWALLTDAEHRRYLLQDGWRSISRVFVLAYALDIVYQFIVMRELRPLQALFTAILLALVPYVIVRGPVNRLAPAQRSEGAS
jgi:hypothetical protein